MPSLTALADLQDRMALAPDQQSQLRGLQQQWHSRMQAAQQRASRLASVTQSFMHLRQVSCRSAASPPSKQQETYSRTERQCGCLCQDVLALLK